jgi:yecA family protein
MNTETRRFGMMHDVAVRTIDDDGIASLIGPPSVESKAMAMDQSLSDDELNELDDFLANESIEETSMDVSTLEGFLTAIAIGPRTVLPSEWLPWVWDRGDGEAEAAFENLKHANRVMSLVMRHYNAVVRTFMDDPASFNGAPPNGARVSCSVFNLTTRHGVCWPSASQPGLRLSCGWAPTMASISPGAPAMPRSGCTKSNGLWSKCRPTGKPRSAVSRPAWLAMIFTSADKGESH